MKAYNFSVVAVLVTALASIHCGASGSDDEGDTSDAFTASNAPDPRLIGTWVLTQTDAKGNPVSLEDQQKIVGTGDAAVKEWKLDYNVLSFTFTTTRGPADTKGEARYTGSYVHRQDGSLTKTDTQTIEYSTDIAAGKIREKDTGSANASIDNYKIVGDILTMKSSGITRTLKKK
jgi:hypothetical protein